MPVADGYSIRCLMGPAGGSETLRFRAHRPRTDRATVRQGSRSGTRTDGGVARLVHEAILVGGAPCINRIITDAHLADARRDR